MRSFWMMEETMFKVMIDGLCWTTVPTRKMADIEVGGLTHQIGRDTQGHKNAIEDLRDTLASIRIEDVEG